MVALEYEHENCVLPTSTILRVRIKLSHKMK